LIGFDGENQNVGGFGHVLIGFRGSHSEFIGEMVSGGGDRVSRNHVLGPDQFGMDEAAGERGGHFARPEKSDGEFGCHENFVAGQLMERK
jgi:hypothetical protein